MLRMYVSYVAKYRVKKHLNINVNSDTNIKKYNQN